MSQYHRASIAMPSAAVMTLWFTFSLAITMLSFTWAKKQQYIELLTTTPTLWVFAGSLLVSYIF